MPLVDEPLGLPADRSLVRRLYAAGLIGREARDEAVEWLRPRAQWSLWTQRLLLLAGTALILCGVVFFFAYNWATLPKALKLALPQAGLLGSLVAAWRIGLDRLGGKLCLVGATVMTGAALGVYGQIYQTGADAWQLFAGWAALSAGFVAVSRFAGHWALWLAIVEAAVGLHLHEITFLGRTQETPLSLTVLGWLNAAALVGIEAGRLRGVEWLKPAWFPRLVLAAALYCLTVAGCWFIVDAGDAGASGFLGLVGAIGLVAGGVLYHRRGFDVGALVMLALSACTLVLFGVGRAVFEISDDACAFLAMGFLTLGIVGGATGWLVYEWRARRTSHE